jgi:hypothetical protein
MIIGPDNILRCRACGAHMRQRTYHSFNTFRAQLWSDGYYSADGSADPDWTLCPGCKAGLYVRELEVVGKGPDEYGLHIERVALDSELRNVRDALKDRSIFTRLGRLLGLSTRLDKLKKTETELEAMLTDTDPDAYPGSADIPSIAWLNAVNFKYLLKRGVHGSDNGKEISLRLAYWWAMNDPVRKDPELRPRPLEEHHANLKRLEELLLAKGDPDVRIVALRMELGRFEEASHYLSALPEREETKEQRDTFNTAIEQRVDRVFLIL